MGGFSGSNTVKSIYVVIDGQYGLILIMSFSPDIFSPFWYTNWHWVGKTAIQYLGTNYQVHLDPQMMDLNFTIFYRPLKYGLKSDLQH